MRDIPGVRSAYRAAATAAQARLPTVCGVAAEDLRVPGPAGAPDVAVRVYQPAARPVLLPAILSIHGGGYVFGDIEEDDIYLREIVRDVRCVAVSVEYRLAPEHPFPAPSRTATQRWSGWRLTSSTWASRGSASPSSGRAPEVASPPGWRFWPATEARCR